MRRLAASAFTIATETPAIEHRGGDDLLWMTDSIPRHYVSQIRT